MPLAIITVIYQNYTVLADFLQSLAKQTDKNFHLFIADLSKDKQKIDTKNIPATIIEAENQGYADGVNEGINKALKEGYSQFAIVNSDVYFAENFVSKATQSLENHPGSIIGGKIYYASGFEYHKERYNLDQLGKVFWYAGGSIDWNHVLVKHRGVDELDTGQYDRFEETDFETGCLMCYDKSVVETVGPWDKSYFLYYEDADFSMRAKKKGVKLYYDPLIVIWHKNAQSTDGAGSDLHQKYQKKNRLKFGLKYSAWKIKLHLLKNLVSDIITKID